MPYHGQWPSPLTKSPDQSPDHPITRLPDGPANLPAAIFVYTPVAVTQEQRMGDKSDILQGTLDLMVLQTLGTMGPLHGYGIARRIEQISEDVLQLNQGTIYASLVRLQQRRWITASWGVSDNNRRAKFYTITKAGRRRLAEQTDNWERIAGVIGRMLRLSEER
jgi:PadR family transcriptional regulator